MVKLEHALTLLALIGGCDNGAIGGPATGTAAQGVVSRTDIVGDLPGAAMIDPTLKNAWGLAFNPVGLAWVSATESGLSAVYQADGRPGLPAVMMPVFEGEPSSPTGQVHNPAAASFFGDSFIFVTEQGLIAGWQPSDGTSSRLRVDNSASLANYKGVALASGRLYAADFYGGKIDVFDGNYAPIAVSFKDPNLPSGFAPFNVAEVDGRLIVTWAMQDAERKDDVKGAGLGYVDLFDTDGNLMRRLISGGELNAPWGVARAPASFAAAPNRLLIGNFGDGMIHFYDFDVATGATLGGTLRNSAGADLALDGLWAIGFAPSAAGGFATDQLYFTAGPDDEEHGVFGRLQTSSLSGTVGGGTGGTGGGSTVYR